MENIHTKVCSRCNNEKCIEHFSTRKDSIDGYRDQCKECMSIVRKARALRNTERNISNLKDPNSTKHCKSCDRILSISEFPNSYTKKDGKHPYCKECTAAACKKHYDSNSSTIIANVRAYYNENKDTINAKNAAYKKTTKGILVIKQSNEKRRALKKTYMVEAIDTLKFAKDRSLCFWGNKPHNGTYHIDHFYPLSRGGTHTISNIVVSCPTCNLKKSVKDPEVFAKEIVKDLTRLFEEDCHDW